jgi:hypothetical protein
MSLNLGTSYDFEADSLNWRDLNASASTSIRTLNVSMSSAFWLYNENAELSPPILRNYSLNLSMGSLGARGKLWGGDFLELDSLFPDDPIEYRNAGAQDWNFSFTPAYSFQMSRMTQTDVFKPRKNYNLSASAAINFTKDWSINWGGNYNFVENQMVQNSFSIHADLECWEMRFEWRPERLNPGYYFLINIKKIPEIKWEERS